MFFEVLFHFLLVLILGTFLVSCIWLLTYQFCSFLMPHWLAGIFASGIIWVRHQKPSKLVIAAIAPSTIVDMLLWSDLWFWTILMGGLVALVVWLFSEA